ncbi:MULTISPECIES: amino acid ABC transporter substrate-binding protein [unclassified Nesterenkonia]|uniref:amino acid ABC transporter substrate-binding protein n=1 Tax=unclassified Nesterenkonia TaxID=2629769 RepID=UPI001F4C6B66|nr:MULTISPECIES: amino acid ABC transporter substrate-binding protein [unclassified Nesterenkonia]MCH8559987.1 amino acid ABC transporter substrate-binding protein [Nesterenkonia sp. DZ6]MCH8562167.1 amino acid ABC transporter substrate-binding protein [Nesterenkonia sp. YGD6]MCH8569929.1 amino acid ABC transporter substrate-binding protein [Nesterenkonia sp. AY15]
MTTRLLSTLAISAAAALTLASCGGGDEAQEDGAPAEESAAGLTLEEVQETGVLTVGTEGTYRPFSFHEGGAGELTGYDVEIVTAVAEELGVEADFEETQWDAMFAGLESERFDVIANQVSITEEREESYLFSAPYTVSNGVIVTLAENEEISSFEDLDGATTAQSLTSNWNDLATESGANVEAVEGWAQSVTLLEQGRVDATINDKLTYLDYQETEGNENIKIAAETEDQSQAALTFRQGSESLVEAVDEALAALAEDGTLTEISEKYFGADVTE